MTLQADIAVKFNLYTLACRKLLNRLTEIHAATQKDTRLDYLACLECFDNVIKEFFRQSYAADITEAAEQFGNALRAQAGYFHNKKAKGIIFEIVDVIRTSADSWHYPTDLDTFHDQGCQIARNFFSSSPNPNARLRLGEKCQLVFEYGDSNSDDRIANKAEKFNLHVVPLAYYPKLWDEERGEDSANILLARFSFEHSFAHYLSYPFLFLHEYTAHIYANDYENERFNDGWMLHAAAAFLRREWSKTPEKYGLNWEQADAFYERLYGTLGRIARNSCLFAQRLDGFLESQHLSGRFMEYTYELAAFQPHHDEKGYWPTQFINALELEFTSNPDRLVQKVEASKNARELYKTLTPI